MWSSSFLNKTSGPVYSSYQGNWSWQPWSINVSAYATFRDNNPISNAASSTTIKIRNYLNTKIIVKFIFISLVTINMDCGNYAYPPGNDHISPIKGRPIEEEIVWCQEASDLGYGPQAGADFFARLGFQYAKQGDYKIARQSFQTAIKRQPDLPVAYASLVSVFLPQNAFKEAIVTYPQVIQMNPDSSQAYKDLGFAYLKDAQYEAAAQTYRRIIQLWPNSADSYHALGSTYMVLGWFSEAKTVYQKR